MGFYRRPSPLEFSYLALDQPDYSPLVNQFFIKGEGDIELSALKLAVNKAAIANPGLQLQLKGFWGWRYWSSNAQPPLVEELQAPDWNSETSVGAPCLGAPIDVRQQPPCQIYKIHAANGLHLLFRTHHGVTDGRGFIRFIDDVFCILRNEPALGANAKVTEWDIAQREDYPLRTLTEGNCASPIAGTKTLDQRGCHWFRFEWAGNKNKFAAKLIKALHEMTMQQDPDGRFLVRVPADLRRYMDQSEGFTNANCSGAIDLDVLPDDKVSNIRSALVKAMRNKQDLSVFEPRQRYARWLPRGMFQSRPETLAQLHQTGRYRMSTTVSYLGDIECERYYCPGFTATAQFGIPIPFETRPLFVGACSYGEVTNIVVSCPKAIATMPELQQFCQALSERLDIVK